MFGHIFLMRIKCIVRDKHVMIWTLIFPIILATMFHFAFADLGKAETFTKSDIAVVNNAEYQSDKTFQSALTYMTRDDTVSGSKAYFNVTYCDKNKADQLLKSGKIIGYINFDNGPKLVVKESGLYQTILKEFLNDYLQTNDAAAVILKENPAAMRSFSENIQSVDYLHPVAPNKGKPDETLNYFYALIGMACLYGGFQGMKEVSAIQANQTTQGARINLAPVHKLKVFTYSLCAATAVQCVTLLLLLAYLAFVLQIDFGGKILYILLAAIVCCCTGVSLGALVGALIKKGEGIKTAVLITISMVMSFLSGLMFGDMKYIVQTNVPILAWLNPGSVITDTFYSLYYYDTYTRFFTNIAVLLGFTIVFTLILYFTLRRQRYESI